MAMSGRSAVRVGPETETERGWSYEATLAWSADRSTRHTVTLSWADHDLLSAGFSPPSRTVEVALGVVVEAGEASLGAGRLPPRFDISTLRRLLPGFDDLVQERL